MQISLKRTSRVAYVLQLANAEISSHAGELVREVEIECAHVGTDHGVISNDSGITLRSGRPGGSTRKRRSAARSEEHTSELQSQSNLVCRLLLEKKILIIFGFSHGYSFNLAGVTLYVVARFSPIKLPSIVYAIVFFS